jgi:hypothetical protein
MPVIRALVLSVAILCGLLGMAISIVCISLGGWFILLGIASFFGGLAVAALIGRKWLQAIS